MTCNKFSLRSLKIVFGYNIQKIHNSCSFSRFFSQIENFNFATKKTTDIDKLLLKTFWQSANNTNSFMSLDKKKQWIHEIEIVPKSITKPHHVFANTTNPYGRVHLMLFLAVQRGNRLRYPSCANRTVIVRLRLTIYSRRMN